MQRYPATSFSGGVSNNAVGGSSSRENARVDSGFSTSNFNLNARRPSSLIPYKIKCDKEPLNSRLGPPDFYPQTPNCPEETLTREYIQSGYKETVEGIEEAREIVLTQAAYFSKSEIILKCKEAIRKRLRLINESRCQKRKVYGVPLSGPLLIKPGAYPDQKPCGEDFRRKWIEALSQQHKRLCSLADHVPHGYRKKSLFEVLIRYNVPLLKATWFIKVTYLNQVRPATNNITSGKPDKAQFVRTDLWTKDVIEYLCQLWDDFFSKDGSSPAASGRDHAMQTPLQGLGQQRSDSASSIHDVEEPSLQFKWWYMVHLLNWHYSEGLLLPSVIIEWVLGQLQEKESAEALELLLPVLCDVIESISLSQTYVQTFVDIAVRSIDDLCPTGLSLLDDSKIPPLASALIEMLHYLIVAVPDTFVALDCFQLPAYKLLDMGYKNAIRRSSEHEDDDHMRTENTDLRYLSLGHVISTIQKRASNVANIVNPSLDGHGAAKVLKVLDKILLVGDVRSAYSTLFEDLSDVTIGGRWITEVSPCLRSSLEWIGTVNLSLICSVFFLCEWATCDYRDCRTSLPQNLKFTGGKDVAQAYIAVLLLKLKKEDMHNPLEAKSSCIISESSVHLHDNVFGQAALANASAGNSMNSSDDRKSKTDIFQSPGPLHDIIVCWLDQHETGRGFGSYKCLQVLLVELIRNGIFYPQAYVRQLIVSGIMDGKETSFDMERRARHHRILKQLPGICLSDVLEEAQIAEAGLLYEAAHIYSNERRLALHGLLTDCAIPPNGGLSFSLRKQRDHSAAVKDGMSLALLKAHRKSISPVSKQSKVKKQVAEIKGSISTFLQLPNTCSLPVESKAEGCLGSIERPLGSFGVKVCKSEATAGCEECRRAKRQKLGDGSSSYQLFSLYLSDDEDTWWVRKGLKLQDSFKSDPALKLSKNGSRGRQKMMRKTQSLAQLASARTESSQEASTSHICHEVHCPDHRSRVESNLPNHIKKEALSLGDIGRRIKCLRLLEKRSISIWLLTLIKQMVEGNDKSASRQNDCTSAFSVPFDDRNAGQWKLGEDELSAILYILDISCDLISAVRFILWLLPKIVSAPGSTVQLGRNTVTLPKNREAHGLQVGEAFLLSALQRYENIIVAADLLPEVLAASMHCAVCMMATNGRTINSASFYYARILLKKYRDVATVVKWEKKFRPTCDHRLLAELDAVRTADGDLGFSSGVSAGMNDFDDYFRHKMNGRTSRTGPVMKGVVQRHIEEVVRYFYAKERKPFEGGTPKSLPEKLDDAYQVAQGIVQGLVECIRQNGGATLEGDPSIVASAVSAIISSVGPPVAKLLDVNPNNNYQGLSSSTSSRTCVGHIICIYITSLSMLKDALGDRLSRIFDLALACEAYSAVSGAFVPGKTHHTQFQSSPETHDVNSSHSNENFNNSAKIYAGRVAKAAAVSALVVGAIVHGVTDLERMITVFKLKEGLDVLQFIRNKRTSSNGTQRGSFKLEHSVEVYVHWFRLLVGNCRTIFDGLVADILGESYVLALSRMQQMLPLSVVLPSAYSIFAMVIWRPYILNRNTATREEVQLYRSLSLAMGDVIRHHPFRDSCLRNTQVLYDFLASDVSDSEFAAMLEMHNPDKHLKTMAFVPLRARMFLNAIIDCEMPAITQLQEDGSWLSRPVEKRENETKLLDKVVHVFDTLQPAKFHWQWVELRFLLNEQALIEKIETKDMSFVDAVRSLSPNSENFAISESEKFLSEIVLTRILVRPDAAPLYAEIARVLGRSLEESLVMDIKWLLAGSDVLSGRKSVRQQLVSVAQRKGLSAKAQFWKPWGWSCSAENVVANKVDRNKVESFSIEEGEVVDEPINIKLQTKISSSSPEAEAFGFSQQYGTEKALVELILPCIDRSSSDLRNSFAAELIKQMSTIDQQLTMLARGGSKQASGISSGVEVSSNKGSSRKSMRGGSPGMGRRPTGVIDSSPPSSAKLKASLWLRLQFLVRLLPIIYADREPSPRNMRYTFASIVLRFLGSRFIYEDADISLTALATVAQKRESQSNSKASTFTSWDRSGDSLFDLLLSVLHGLLSCSKPSWLKPKSSSKSTVKSPREFSVFDREVAESLQTDLDRMEIPATIRRRLQAAMPILPPSPPISFSCQLPALSSTVLASIQPSTQTPHLSKLVSLPRPSTNLSTKSKALASLDSDMEIDPWTLLEDGTVSASSSSNSGNVSKVNGDHANLKACSWLKGAVRVRRRDLTYVGALDDDS
ncbi:mediator of RNA polymerase II transcription subunit 12-like isoform X2 [Asparagus officinalis]|uniref:mediator of RNA polymerase II transcription subunit 12-like isoform X2 n=1 Tax=Asparagus officinalis TaxID=4686 RepID=UPI00098E61A3|nr:mediator of RNA polymerase II transcription subunit 12-like isoform X2 [Asparagus officinalis]